MVSRNKYFYSEKNDSKGTKVLQIDYFIYRRNDL